MEQHTRRIVFWNRFWLTIVMLLLIGSGAWRLLSSIIESMYDLRPSWSEDGLGFSASSDGPFVITHLVDRRQYATAALQPPLAYIDSGRLLIPIEQFKKLKWYSKFGEEVTAPKDGLNVTALYYRPQEARKRDEIK